MRVRTKKVTTHATMAVVTNVLLDTGHTTAPSDVELLKAENITTDTHEDQRWRTRFEDQAAFV